MQNRSRILTVSAIAITLAACTSTAEKTSYVAPQPVSQTASIQPDEEYVSRVEMMARKQGADVRWINVPTKRVATNQ
jgi:hypothetical protein